MQALETVAGGLAEGFQGDQGNLEVFSRRR